MSKHTRERQKKKKEKRDWKWNPWKKLKRNKNKSMRTSHYPYECKHLNNQSDQPEGQSCHETGQQHAHSNDQHLRDGHSDQAMESSSHQPEQQHAQINDPHLHGYSDEAVESSSHLTEQQHAQSQVELHRTIQACFQMLYDVFDYTIGMIEELEKHEEHGKQVKNSGILSRLIPVDYKKPIQDVTAGIELELMCLKAQMKSHPPEVTSEARKGLIMQVIKWAASRSAAGIPYSPVDDYCKNVLEILLFGAPQELPNVVRAPKIKLTTEQVNEAMHQMAVQRHLGEKQDEEFDGDPSKEATLRSKRQTESIREGALRLTTHDDSHLAQTLEEHGYVQDLLTDAT